MSLHIISWNVNGIRAMWKRDFVGIVKKLDPDVLCLQEIKAQAETLPDGFQLPGYSVVCSFAEKKGYSGVAVFSKTKPDSIKHGIGFKRFDNEGRFLELDLGGFSLINTYIPHGARDKSKLPYKLEAYGKFLAYLQRRKSRPYVLMGDFNIAHDERDLARPKENRDGIMFTPEERKQLDALLGLGFIDSFRKFHDDGGHYTWWPYFVNARERNLGWRLDYGFVSTALSKRLRNADIHPKVMGSDHCPVSLELV